MNLHLVSWMFFAGVMALGAGVVSGQDYPNKTIRVVAGDAGASGDFSARLIGQGLTASLGQSVIVDNRPAASGAVAAEIVSRAPPDGYTLLIYGSAIWVLPFLRYNVSFDMLKDFSPVTLAMKAPGILVVYPLLSAKSVKELIALAKAKPRELNYASAATGSINHLGAELFKSMAGVDIVRISYKGPAPALADLIGGQVQLMFSTAPPVTPHVKSGRLKALAVTSAEPSALFPDLPTVAATGLPGYEWVNSIAVLAPAKTPAAVVNQLNQEIVRVLKSAEVKEKVFNAGSEIVGSSPEQLTAAMKSEMTRLGKVIKDAGIREE